MKLTKHGKRQQRVYGALIASVAWVLVLTFYTYGFQTLVMATINDFKRELSPVIQYAETGIELQESVIMLTEEREGK